MSRLWVLLAALAMLVLPGLAEQAAARSHRPQAPYCLRGPTGGLACHYNSLDQCRRAASGTGGTCMRNPHYGRRR